MTDSEVFLVVMGCVLAMAGLMALRQKVKKPDTMQPSAENSAVWKSRVLSRVRKV